MQKNIQISVKSFRSTHILVVTYSSPECFSAVIKRKIIAIEIDQVTMISYRMSKTSARIHRTALALAEIQFGRCPEMKRDSNKDWENVGRIHKDAREARIRRWEVPTSRQVL